MSRVEQGLRNMVILGVGENQFLVHADDAEAEVRAGLQKMLPDIAFELKPIAGKAAKALRSKLSAPQTEMVEKFSRKLAVKPAKRTSSAFLVQIQSQDKLAAVATKNGILTFNPEISKVVKPLGGGIGPVGVTVGVGIAGKF